MVHNLVYSRPLELGPSPESIHMKGPLPLGNRLIVIAPCGVLVP